MFNDTSKEGVGICFFDYKKRRGSLLHLTVEKKNLYTAMQTL